MRTLKNGLLFLALTLFTFNLSLAQDENQTMFSVHTDNVKFEKMVQYEESIKELNANFVKYNIQDVKWTAISIEDGRYVFVSPLKNMAELDKNIMAPLFEKMDKEEVSAMFNKMNECYDSHSNSIVHYVPSLSYHPEGEESSEGKNYREYHFLYYPPRNGNAMKDGMKAVKELFENKGIKSGYSVYHSGFGNEEGYYMVSISANDELEIAQNGKANDEAFGKEGQAVFFEVIKLTTRYDQVTGRIRPDLSYYPKKE